MATTNELLAAQLLRLSSDRSASPIARGFAGFLGGRNLRRAESDARQKAEEKEEEEAFRREQLATALGQSGIDPSILSGLPTSTLESVLTKQLTRQPDKPLSPEGKLVFDIERGAVPGDIGAAALQRRIAPRVPLVKIGAGETEFQKGTGRALFQKVQKTAEKAETATSLLQSAAAIESTFGRTLPSGPFAEGISFFTGVANQLNIPLAADRLANTATFVAESNKLVGGLIKDLGSGTGISDKDLEFTIKRVPNILNTEQGNRNMVEIIKFRANASLDEQGFVDQIVEQRDQFPTITKFNTFFNKRVRNFRRSKLDDFNILLDNLSLNSTPIVKTRARRAGSTPRRFKLNERGVFE